MKQKFDWEKGFGLSFDPVTGYSPEAETTKRYLSQMKGMYLEEETREAMCSKEDPLVYEFYELGTPETGGDLAFGTTILYPGKVGDEYFMTKGHFHTVLDTAEIYCGLKGTGYMLMENLEGDVQIQPVEPGRTVYVPKGYAHRSINSGAEPLVMFFVFRGDAGHNYGTIEEKGYRKLCVESEGRPVFTDNPRWSDTGK